MNTGLKHTENGNNSILLNPSLREEVSQYAPGLDLIMTVPVTQLGYSETDPQP